MVEFGFMMFLILAGVASIVFACGYLEHQIKKKK